MIGGNPYFTELLMKDRVRHIHREVIASRLPQGIRAGAQGWLARVGQRLFQQSGHALDWLGSWLEEKSGLGEEALDGQMRPAP